ncbi:tripartite tricarboxylate transporter substrate binding protein [Bordetella sp. BOR01]|uniref:tripartite tricarboxylate transporter substrate binding protein n=1 Tax=Bordetella sp. BOR01 TaxID=2854779 RepID=UPI001C47492B|nr:tripartite tricarboxylate transporter substrate binding protein [Bordetella sp. BOR01]MBV7482757.1 tripartite tricarboxylate transporter substrate binding protein [Bordetella sp. BOR01]
MKLHTFRCATALAACALFTTIATAAATATEDYPSRPIRLIVPFAPGGGADVLARIVGQKLGENLKQPVLIENRSGAGGNLGTDLVAKAEPDGYTLVLGVVGPISINVSLFDSLPYDPVKDLAPITQAVMVTNLLVINPGLKVDSVAELIELAKSKPGTLSFASGGTGTAGHLAGELFKTMAGVDITHVPYRGSGPAINDLIGGQVQLFFDNMPSALPQARSGRLKALGVTTARRSSAAPDIPTIAESGLPGFEANNWYGFLTAAGTPKPIIDKLNREIVRVLNMPDVKERLVAMGAEVIGNTPEEFALVIREEIPKWRQVVQDSGAKVN